MVFELGDKVMVRANSDELESELFQAIDGVRAEISEIYSTDYDPDTKRYEVTLENPVEVNGERMAVIPGLYEDNLERAEGEKKPKELSENRAIPKFAIFEERMQSSAWYYGLADCHGIESFVKEPEGSEEWAGFDELIDAGVLSKGDADLPARKTYNMQVRMMMHRARAHDQRWPVIYRAKLRMEDAVTIDRMLNKGLYDDALSYLKEVAEEVQLAKGFGSDSQRRWEKIPNPELDPSY